MHEKKNIYTCIHEELLSRGYIMTSRDDRIFKALLWFSGVISLPVLFCQDVYHSNLVLDAMY